MSCSGIAAHIGESRIGYENISILIVLLGELLFIYST
jgi:hypothetical protein